MPRWIQRWEAAHPFFRMEAFFLGHVDKSVVGIEYYNLLGISRNRHFRMHYLNEDLRKVAAKALKLLTDKKKMREYSEIIETNNNRIVAYVRRTLKEAGYLSNKELAARYKRIISMLSTLFATYNLSRPEFFVEMEKKVKRHIKAKNRLSDEEIHKHFVLLSTPTETTLLYQEEVDWFKLLIDAKRYRKNKGAILCDLEKHQKKYGWIGSAEQKNIWDVGFYKERYSRESKKSLEALENRLSVKEKKTNEFYEQQLKTLKLLNLEKESVYLLGMAKKIAGIRMSTRHIWVETTFILDKIFDVISRRCGAEKQNLESYRLKEMMDLLLKNKKVPQATIKAREHYAFLMENNKIKLFVGCEDVERLERKAIRPIDNDGTKELKGKIAHPGFARGIVKIIDPSKDQEKEIRAMKKGQILVTSMTRPHLIEAIKKAAAIVTDEGGVTCHAAIVAREFDIPCIVGTKIATKVLKDGDKVEVNADSGIVKKI